jgi:hypothetical protein
VTRLVVKPLTGGVKVVRLGDSTRFKIVVRNGPTGPQGPEGPAGSGGGGSAGLRVALTSDTTLTSSDNGNTYTNTGAAGTVIATLPASSTLGSGTFKLNFRLTVAQLLRVKAQGSDVLRYYGSASPAAGYLEIDERDAALDVEYVGGGVFLVTAALCNWIFGPTS